MKMFRISACIAWCGDEYIARESIEDALDFAEEWIQKKRQYQRGITVEVFAYEIDRDKKRIEPCATREVVLKEWPYINC